MNAKTWYHQIRQEFSGETYRKWLVASYAIYSLDQLSPKTGDLLLFKAWEPYATDPESNDGQWNQSAMILKDPSDAIRDAYSLNPEKNLFVLEADISTTGKKEIRLVPFEDLITFYQNAFGQDFLYVYRQLELPNRKSEDSDTFPELENWLLTIKGRHYSPEKEATYSLVTHYSTEMQHRSLFSAHFITATYKEMGLLQNEEFRSFLNTDLSVPIQEKWEKPLIGLRRGAALAPAGRLAISQ